MTAVFGRFLQVVGLVVSGTGCVLAFRAETSEAAFIAWGFGGFAIFFIGSRLRGVRAL